MGTGYIDWQRLDRTLPWIRQRMGQRTYVMAFWLVDYGHSNIDHGVGLLKPEDQHPDWFLHACTADHVLAAYPNPKNLISPNYGAVFGDGLMSRPLLASMVLGTTDGVYRRREAIWWASNDDLTRRGKRLVRDLDRLYERPSHLITFIEGTSDENSGSRGSV